MTLSPVALSLLGLLLAALSGIVGAALALGRRDATVTRVERDLEQLRADLRLAQDRFARLEVAQVQQAALAETISHLKDREDERHKELLRRLDAIDRRLSGAPPPT